ncbi:MAG: sialate O-acetylesterase [Victivallaceae bacterium]
MKSVYLWLAAAFALVGCVSSEGEASATAGIILTPLVSDHAVVQRDMPIPVWGYAAPGARITAEFNGGAAETLANQDGYFILRLPAQPAGGPYVLTLTDKAVGRSLKVNDLYVGEVWLAGGQSNMAFKVSAMTDVDLKDPAQTLRPGVRFFNVPRTTEPGNLTMATGGEWISAAPETVGSCSAVGYYFARKLNDELEIPVGVICSTWGGTNAEGWISRKTQMADPELRARLENNPSMNSLQWWKSYDSKYGVEWLLKDYYEVNDDLNNEARESKRAQLESDPGEQGDWIAGEPDSSWTAAKIPGCWSDNGDAFKLNGVVWFRTSFDLPESMVGKELELHLGAIDKTDETFLNGRKVGATGKLFAEDVWNVPRVYKVPAGVAQLGKNILAIRNVSHIYAGGLIGPAEEMYVTDGKTRIDLAQEPWLAKVSQNIGGQLANISGPASMYIPGILYQNMIAPLQPVGLRGVIWYQGEANASHPGNYAKLMKLLIEDWRYNFENPQMAFIQVQLAGFTEEKGIDLDSKWALIREAQQQAAVATGNGWVSAHDIGDAGNIHPQKKWMVGERLAACAMAQVYGSKAPSMGPILDHAEFAPDKTVLSFQNSYGTLKVREGDTLTGLYGSSDGKEFHAVKAEISGNKVVVWEPGLTELCYGWSDNPHEANLANAAGLPAYCFRIKNN